MSSERKKLSPERLAEIEREVKLFKSWIEKGCGVTSSKDTLLVLLWEHCQALEADNARLEADLHNLVGYSEQSDRDAEAALTIADNKIAQLEQELAQANNYLSIFDCAGCDHPYTHHEGFGLRCNDCFCDGYIAHREIIESREAIAKLKQELAAARARIAELEANQKRMLKVHTGWLFLTGDTATDEACDKMLREVGKRLRAIAKPTATTTPTQPPQRD